MTSTETKTPAKTTARKAAPAKKAATPKVATTTAPAARKLRWKLAEAKVDNKPVEQTAEVEGHTYAITKAGDGWKATVTVDGGKAEVLVDGTFAKAYTACVTHNRARA
jgi:hypothetical protein